MRLSIWERIGDDGPIGLPKKVHIHAHQRIDISHQHATVSTGVDLRENLYEGSVWVAHFSMGVRAGSSQPCREKNAWVLEGPAVGIAGMLREAR